MRHFVFLIPLLLFSIADFVQGNEMNDYQKRIMERRLAEARLLWKKMEAEGFTTTTPVALDFVFFSDSKDGAEGLAVQLSDNYSAETSPASQPGYLIVRGTTRPYGNEFDFEQWIGWVEFMVSVGFKNDSVFSTWSVEAPSQKMTWSSEELEAK